MLSQRNGGKDTNGSAASQNDAASLSSGSETLKITPSTSYNSIYSLLDLGNRLPQFLTNHTAHLPGFAALDLWQPGGLGTVMDKAEAAAKDHPSQICRFYVGPYLAAYVRDQEHIRQIYLSLPSSNPHEKEAYGDSSGIYPYLFGPSILSFSKNDPRWKKERDFYTSGLMKGPRLDSACIEMGDIMKKHLELYPPHSITNVAQLRQFVNRAIATMVAQTQLGFIDLTEQDKDRLAQLVADGLPQMSTLKNVIYFKMEEKLGCRPRIPFDKIRSGGYAFLESLLIRNKDYILEDRADKPELFLKQFLRKRAEEKRQETSESQVLGEISKEEMEEVLLEESKRFAALVLFAGYESTSTSTFFNLLLLADPKHKELQDEIRAQILSVWNPNESLTKIHLRRMDKLDMAFREALRLYPPFPTFKDVLPHDVQLGDVKLTTGTLLFVSPIRTHRIANSKNIAYPRDYNLNDTLRETDPKCHFMTFGFPPRLCPGRELAMLEGKIISAYTMVLCAFTLQNLQHPFDVKELYSLHLADSIDQANEAIEFTPLEKQISFENDPQAENKSSFGLG